MELKQQLKMSQQLVMTPQLQQAIKLLQMSRIELIEVCAQELLENPVLDGSLPDPLFERSGAEQAEAAVNRVETTARSGTDNTELSPTLERVIEADELAAANSSREANSQRDDIDWERYIENQAMQGPVGGGTGRGPSDDFPSFEANYTKSEDLVDHLLWQLQMSDFVNDERAFAALVFGNLDDRGFLVLDGVPKDEIVPRLAEEAEIHPEDAEEVLKLLQRFDPMGVAARDLRECLLVQALYHGMDELVVKVISDHMSDLEHKNYRGIAKALDATIEDIYDVAQVIAELEPRPARNFSSTETQYITPDVHVQKVGEDYVVVANDDGMPRLKISSFYRTAIRGDDKAREYIQNKLRSAQWLIRSIDQRRRTIEKVTECIVRRQRDFFELGIDHLKPMILRDVAEEIGMHESTISRVTSNKYVNTPRGLLELKFFFNSAIRRSGNKEEIASESVKQAIKKLVESEPPDRPFSDQRLVELLKSQEVDIARRTVAKYREMLGILTSSQRKRYF